MSIATVPAADVQRDALAASLASLPPIGLAALADAGSLLTRKDRKYVLPTGRLPGVIAWSGDRARVLEIDSRRSSDYESVYFDTPQLTSYLMAARRRRRRFKVRTRSYLDSGQCWLEAKTRDGRGHTVKTRMAHDASCADHLTPDGRDFLAATLRPTMPDCEKLVADLEPELVTRYQRATLFLPGDSARVTVDVNLRAIDRCGHELAPAEVGIVETKTSGPPSAMDRLLWSLGYRPVRISKYATSMAALHPVLPANRWTPALRHLGVVPR